MLKKAFLLVIIAMMAMGSAQAKKLSATLNYATFYNPVEGPYIETYLSINAASIELVKNELGKFQGTIEILVLFKQNDKIINYNKYDLLSPEFDDSTKISYDFIDLQRYRLQNGNYSFEISITDKYNKSSSFKTRIPIDLIYDESNVIVSGIQFVESYTPSKNGSPLAKSGLDIIPHPSNFYPAADSQLILYAEIYHSAKILGPNEKFLITTYIQPKESNNKLDYYTRHKREIAADVNVVFSNFDISKLPSGNYYYSIEIRNKENKLIAFNSIFFQRSNPELKVTLESSLAEVDQSFTSKYTSRDTLASFVRFLRPIATQAEKIFIDQDLRRMELKSLQAFFLFFWKERNLIDPESAWMQYLSEVMNVNRLYSSGYTKGYDTDRGRVHLQYGAPNSINDNPFDTGIMGSLSDTEINKDVSSTVPYQIWHYYTLKNQRNKIFIFYNPHLVPNEYQLLHSDAMGELSNPQWKAQLHREPMRSIDNESSSQGVRGNIPQ
ncbi:MAG: GWxTD domain-containing protein [Bacteroidales bacterium]|nr:GWxTD domain-containing protein [Bacteroidales bacterium]